MPRKLGRPFVYQSDEERPITISVRLPKDLYDKLQRYAHIHRQHISDIVKEGLEIRLEQYADPRDLLLGVEDDEAALQDLAARVAQLLEASRLAWAAQPTPSPTHAVTASAGVPLEAPSAELSYDSNVVIPEQTQKHTGRPRSPMGQRILDLLAQRPEGLTSEQIRAALEPSRPLGDILAGMRRTGAVITFGTGRQIRYTIAAQK
jgi:hypothetical protein